MERMVPCVLYAAKSSEDIRGSLPAQLQDCTDTLAAAGGRIAVAEYRDEAVSAFNKSRGPGLADAMREAEALAAQHDTAELWVQHSDRLARGDGRTARHLVEIALWAQKVKVDVRSVQDPDTFRDLLYAVVTGQRNHEDSKRKGAASAAGYKRAVYRGEYAGQPLDGYRVVVTADTRGHVEKHLEIDPEREPLIRLIFRLAKRGHMPTAIARRANRDGWQTAPHRYDHQPGLITPRFVQWVLDHPRYAGLAVFEGEIVGAGRWQGYITPREHKHLRGRPREYKSARLPRQPFLLARLATCGWCGRGMFTLAGRPRKDGTRRRAYVCLGRRGGECGMPQLDAIAIDHVLVASLNRFLGGLEETGPYQPSPGFPRELVRGHNEPNWENIQPIATITAELRTRIGHALRADEHDSAEALLDELVQHRERLRANMHNRPNRRPLDLELSEEPRKLLFDFYGWSANDLAEHNVEKPTDTARLNEVLKQWFTSIVLKPMDQGIEIAPVLTGRGPFGVGAPDPTPAYASPDHWRVALRIAGHGHRYGDHWGEAELIYALRAWATEHGRAPHVADWAHATREHPNANIVIRQFGRWNTGIRAAGLPLAPIQRHCFRINGRLAKVI